MELALNEAKKDPRRVKVGAVVVARNGQMVKAAHGGEIDIEDHAESTLLERKLKDVDLSGATLYTTLEPCTTRHHPDQPCAQLVVRRKIKRVVIGMLDPNPRITGQGELTLKRKGIEVAYFDADLRAKCDLMPDWTNEQKRNVTYDQLFSKLENDRSNHLARFAGLAVHDTLTLRLCPNITSGWLMSEIELAHENVRFSLPTEYVSRYKQFFDEKYEEFGLRTDNLKIMLARNPRSFTDAPYLTLNTKETLFSEVLFYNYVVSADLTKRDQLIREFVGGETTLANFPQILCLHMIAITSDNKMLITKRSPHVAFFPNTWSASFEENMSDKDLEGGREGAVLRWGKRALLEELGITEDVYDPLNLRVLSVFLEGDILNVGLTGHVVLNIASDQLRRIIRSLPRADYEFTAWDFIDYQDDELISEITKPTLPYHPTSRYRMLMTLLKKNGVPRGAERFFR